MQKNAPEEELRVKDEHNSKRNDKHKKIQKNTHNCCTKKNAVLTSHIHTAYRRMACILSEYGIHIVLIIKKFYMS